MTEEIRELLDELVLCRDHIDHGVYKLVPHYEEQKKRVVRDLAEAWARETADSNS